MNAELDTMQAVEQEEVVPGVPYHFALSRRGFVELLGAGLLVIAWAEPVLAQQRGRGRGRGGGRPQTVLARIHLGTDGSITVLAGKVELGQGARAEITQAAAEELRVPPHRIRLILADTALVPNDGNTAGSQTTPSTVPAVRRAAATARSLLAAVACQRWSVSPDQVSVRDGMIVHAASQRQVRYADLAGAEELQKEFAQNVPADVSVTPVQEWKVLGTSFARANARELVTGAHRFPSDIARPNMLYGKVLRPPSFGATLKRIDLAPAKAMAEVVVVQDGDFVGLAAPTTAKAAAALKAIAQTATWEPAPHPASKNLFDYLRAEAQEGGKVANPFAEELAKASKRLRQTYHVAYIQHAPMETRVAVAEWDHGKLTVWTTTQNPFGYRSELARTFRLAEEQVRVIVPDIGGGFGGKHTGEAAVEAARLAQAAQRPVLLKWTREEEFTWAYFRPAGVLDLEAGLDDQGAISVWHHVNINSGGSAIETPYRIPHARSRYLSSRAPLRQGSYRALAATANTFARESFMDELAAAAGADPLEFRLAHLENPRLRAVLESAAQRFDWPNEKKRSRPNGGIGLACSTEKGSYVAACAEVAVDRAQGQIEVLRVSEVFECGAVLNPDNLISQIQGCIIMGLGAALREEMQFADGKMLNATFARYRVPRCQDVPALDLHLLNRPDLPSAGAGETPLIAIAPAIANAVFAATGLRLRALPLRLPA